MRAACSGLVVLALATALAIVRVHLASAQDDARFDSRPITFTFVLRGIGAGEKTQQPAAEL